MQCIKAGLLAAAALLTGQLNSKQASLDALPLGLLHVCAAVVNSHQHVMHRRSGFLLQTGTEGIWDSALTAAEADHPRPGRAVFLALHRLWKQSQSATEKWFTCPGGCDCSAGSCMIAPLFPQPNTEQAGMADAQANTTTRSHKEVLLAQVVEGIEGAALAAAVDALLVTQQNAERAGIAGPPQGWPAWLSALTRAGEGHPDPSSATDTSGQPSTLSCTCDKTCLG